MLRSLNITTGSGTLVGTGGETDRIAVSVASSVFNVRNATCGENCTTCNGATEFQLDPGSYQMALNATMPAYGKATWNTGSSYMNPAGTTWTTANSSIATVNAAGVLTGASPGQTGVTALVSNYPVYTQNCSGDMQGGCPDGDFGDGGEADVTPTVDSVVPAMGLVGTPINVTITGNGFAEGVTVNAGSNISVSNVDVISSTQMTATFTPTNSASAGGHYGVSVTVSEQTSNSQVFLVQYPLHAVYTSEQITPSSGHSAITAGTDITIKSADGTPDGITVATGVCGGYQWLTYTPRDQYGNQINNGTMTVTEALSSFSPSPPTFGKPPATSGNLTLPGGYFGDTQAIWNTEPPACLAASKSDSFLQTFTATIGSVSYPLTTVVTVQRSTNSQGVPTFNISITTP